MAKQSFSPVRVDLEKAVADAKRTRTGFSKAWDTLEEEYTALHALLNARKRAGLTQQDLAGAWAPQKARSLGLRTPCVTENIPRLSQPSRNTHGPVAENLSWILSEDGM